MSKIAILFSGQGAQSVGMGKDLYEYSQNAKAIYDEGERLREGTLFTCFEGAGEDLTLTQNAQPCLFLTDLAFAEELKNAGVKADAAAGFSLGEIPALAFAGILSREDAFRLVALRGRKMGELAEKYPGSMVAALKLDNAAVEETCASFSEVWPVNYNCPGQLSCAGNVNELDDFCAAIKAKGGRAVKLSVSGAFHTPYMKEASEALRDFLQTVEIHAPNLALYANKSGHAYPENSEEIIETVASQASSSVRFEDTIRNMRAEGIDTFIEVGAGKTLTGFVKRTLPDAVTYTVTDVPSLQETLEALKAR